MSRDFIQGDGRRSSGRNSWRPASRRQRCQTRPRAAFSLVELLVVASLLPIVAAVAAALVLRVIDAESRQQQHAERTLALVRLAAEFRADCHAASGLSRLEAEPAAPEADANANVDHAEERAGGRENATDGSGVVLAAAGREIRYRPVANGIEREVLAGDRRESRDLFALDSGCRLEFQVEVTGASRIAVLTVLANQSPAPPLTIAGELGRDARWRIEPRTAEGSP